MFTPGASQTTIVQGQANNQQAQTKKKKKKNNNEAADLYPSHKPDPLSMLQRLEFHAMGGDMLAVMEAESTSQLFRVSRWFEEWEQVLSRFRYDSELTRLNQMHDCPVKVSQTLWDVFQAAPGRLCK